MFAATRAAPLRSASRSLTRAHTTTASTRPLASTAYLDPARSQEPSISTTPQYIPSDLRRELESALRVDQAGELAANWIYKGQHDVLGRDPATGNLIQVSRRLNCLSRIVPIYFPGNVGPREETPCRYEQAPAAASRPSNDPLGTRSNRRLWTWSYHSFDGKGGRHGVYGSCRDRHWRAL